MSSAAMGVTNPAAGVIATRPTTAPVAAPTAVARPLLYSSSSNQVSKPAAAPAWVVRSALAAMPSAASADPALKPNQPNHSSPAPKSAKGTLCGTVGMRLKSRRGPNTLASTSAVTPALICTTVPPAKSSAPRVRSHPPSPHTQCASGSYTRVVHRSPKVR